MSNSPIDNQDEPRRRIDLPVLITIGMPVVEISDGTPGAIVGITQAFCVYRIGATGALVVAPWRDIALGNVCPAAPLLPANVEEQDRHNGSAALLRELLSLEQFGLTATQQTALDELVSMLCSAQPGN